MATLARSMHFSSTPHVLTVTKRCKWEHDQLTMGPVRVSQCVALGSSFLSVGCMDAGAMAVAGAMDAGAVGTCMGSHLHMVTPYHCPFLRTQDDLGKQEGLGVVATRSTCFRYSFE